MSHIMCHEWLERHNKPSSSFWTHDNIKHYTATIHSKGCVAYIQSWHYWCFTLLLWAFETLPWTHITATQYYNDTVLQCYSVTVLQWYSVTECHSITVLQSHSITVLQSVTVPPWNVHTELYVGTSGPTMRLKVDNSGQGGSGKLGLPAVQCIIQKIHKHEKYTNTSQVHNTAKVGEI